MIPVIFIQASLPEPCACCGAAFTKYWTSLPDRETKDQVAVCWGCSLNKEPEAVPTKAAWFARYIRKDPSHV